MAVTLSAVSSQYISGAIAVITGYPFTMFAWFNPNTAGVSNGILDFSNTASVVTNGYKFRADLTNVLRYTTGDGTLTDAVSTSNNWSPATWQRGYHIGTSATARSILLNNTGLGTGAVNLTATGLNTTVIGAFDTTGVKSLFFDGSIAHVAAWNIVLSANDLAALEAGFSPFWVQRANLKMYLPLYDATSNVQDIMQSTTWTPQASPTYTASPAVRVPRYWL